MFNTWKDLREQLPSDLSDDAVELIRRATAPMRHEKRVNATVDAALTAVLEIYSSPDLELRRVTPFMCRIAATLIALDRNGTGGPHNAGGGFAATARMSWARGLGKGRRQASDGAAWMAAAADAESLLLGSAARPEEYSHPAVGWSWHPYRGPDSPPEYQGFIGPDDVTRAVREAVCGDDLEFARSYCRARIVELAHNLQNASTCVVFAPRQVDSPHRDYRAELRAEIAAWDAALRAIDAEIDGRVETAET